MGGDETNTDEIERDTQTRRHPGCVLQGIPRGLAVSREEGNQLSFHKSLVRSLTGFFLVFQFPSGVLLIFFWGSKHVEIVATGGVRMKTKKVLNLRSWNRFEGFGIHTHFVESKDSHV